MNVLNWTAEVVRHEPTDGEASTAVWIYVNDVAIFVYPMVGYYEEGEALHHGLAALGRALVHV